MRLPYTSHARQSTLEECIWIAPSNASNLNETIWDILSKFLFLSFCASGLGHFSDCQNNKHFIRSKWIYPIAELRLEVQGVKHTHQGWVKKSRMERGILSNMNIYWKRKHKCRVLSLWFSMLPWNFYLSDKNFRKNPHARAPLSSLLPRAFVEGFHRDQA